MVKKIPLTQGKFTLVDDQDYDFLNQWKWQVMIKNNTAYAQRFENKTPIRIHRFLLNPPKGFVVDHINGNGLDNRRSNLRVVTHRQNMQNMHVKRSSKYPGVSWRKDRNKWEAKISINNKSKHLGHFKSENEAFEAYKEAVNALDENVIEGGV